MVLCHHVGCVSNIVLVCRKAVFQFILVIIELALGMISLVFAKSRTQTQRIVCMKALR